MSKDTQAVIFRKWRDTGTVIALFPELPSDYAGRYCDSYEHVGQHGGADYYGIIERSTPATAAEAASLAAELGRIGYHLRILKRASWRHHDQRRNAARAIR